MPHTFWLMIATTPWWMYLLFFCLLRISLLMTKPRLVKLKPFYFATLPLIACTFITIYLFPPSNTGLLYSILLLAIGALFGIGRSKWHGIKAVAHNQQLFLPGSWLMFIVIIGFFIIRQYTVYHLELNFIEWVKANGPNFFLPLYAFSLGSTLSQIAYFRRLIKDGPYATQDDLKHAITI